MSVSSDDASSTMIDILEVDSNDSNEPCSSLSSSESVRSCAYAHDPYSFAAYVAVDYISKPRSSSDSASSISMNDKHSSILVIAELGDRQLIAAKSQLRDDEGRAITPCGHLRRLRLRHKGGIAYYCCAECQVKFREIGSHKLREDQLEFLRSGGVPTYL